MTEWERDVYKDMKPIDRVLLYMVKVMEMLEFQQVLQAEDIEIIKEFLLKEGAEHE